MSGSGGGRGDDRNLGGGLGTGGSDDPCIIIKSVPVNSPKEDVLNDLDEGDRLGVALGSRDVVEIHDSSGRTAGSLTYNGVATLIQCIKSGHEYNAFLIRKNLGEFIVEIRPEA